MNPFEIGMGFAYGAAGGILLASVTHIDWLVLPGLFVGGSLGVMFVLGFIDLGSIIPDF